MSTFFVNQNHTSLIRTTRLIACAFLAWIVVLMCASWWIKSVSTKMHSQCVAQNVSWELYHQQEAAYKQQAQEQVQKKQFCAWFDKLQKDHLSVLVTWQELALLVGSSVRLTDFSYGRDGHGTFGCCARSLEGLMVWLERVNGYHFSDGVVCKVDRVTQQGAHGEKACAIGVLERGKNSQTFGS